MDHHRLVSIVEVVQSWLLLLQYEVRVKRQHILQETPKFINFAPHCDLGPCVVLHEAAVPLQLLIELLS